MSGIPEQEIGYSYEQDALAFERHARLETLKMAFNRARARDKIADILRDAQRMLDFVLVETRTVTINRKAN